MQSTRRARRKKGIALIIALFTVFAILTMGVSYIGVSLTNSQATKGLEKEAMAIAFANSGVEFAIGYMGNQANWANMVALATKTSDKMTGNESFTYRVVAIDGTMPDFAGLNFTPAWLSANGRCIETLSSVTRLNVNDAGNNRPLYGHWRIAVVPESQGSITAGTESAFQFNTNFRIYVRARLLAKENPATETELNQVTVASREVMARVSNEFPGSIYQNVRAYDACGGFSYPNHEEMTADAVFVAENFQWDGGMRIDGAEIMDDGRELGRPWATANKADGYGADTSGSLNINTLADVASLAQSSWPKFSGKVVTHQSGVKVSTTTYDGIDFSSSTLFDNLSSIFTNSKDPYQTSVPSLSITDSIWKTTAGTQEKLSLADLVNGTSSDGYFNNLASQSSAGKDKWYVSVPDNEIKLDPYSAYEQPESPTVKITVTPLSGADDGKTRFFVERLIRNPNETSTDTYITDPKHTGFTSFDSDNTDWSKLIYVKGGNVQVVGGDPSSTSIPKAASGVSDSGNLTVPCTIVADTDASRDMAMSEAAETKGVSGIYDGRLTTSNIWDSQSGQYVYRCYDANGNAVEGTENSLKAMPIWADSTANVNTYINSSDPTRYVCRFPPTSSSSNAQPEGNLSVVGDLTYAKDTESPSLGLLSKNHVFLNDFQMAKPGDTGSTADERRTLNLDATIGSRNHSMQMDFFNFSHNSYGKDQATNTTLCPSWKAPSYMMVPCADGDQASGGIKYFNKWEKMPSQAKKQVWWDFYYGADQPSAGSSYTGASTVAYNANYNTMYQKGKFKFNGAIVSRFADVEADAGNGSDVPTMGYGTQQLSYDLNLKNRSAPFFSNACYDKSRARAVMYWSILSYVDRGTISEIKNNL